MLLPLDDEDNGAVIVGEACFNEVAPRRLVARLWLGARPAAATARGVGHVVDGRGGVAALTPSRLAVKAEHPHLVLGEHRAHLDRAPGWDLVHELVFERVRPDRRRGEVLHTRVVEEHPGVEREDAIGGSDEGVNVALHDLRVVHDENAEAHHDVDQRIDVHAFHAADALQGREYLRPLQHFLRQVGVEGRQAQGGVLEHFDE
mmetsp:Transcript_41229/g.119408  ORF Transcript_41229/g.119408 Transcript_41229/m.119408 type:complete len:203 (-) Transcript_41229:599-1207(-)